MRTRILPSDEWPKLAGLDIAELLPHLPADSATVIVVEDDAGKIVETWSMLQVTHLEGFWVDPEHAKKAGVVRALIRTAMEFAGSLGLKWMSTGANTESIATYIRRLGGLKVPAEVYTLPVRKF